MYIYKKKFKKIIYIRNISHLFTQISRYFAKVSRLFAKNKNKNPCENEFPYFADVIPLTKHLFAHEDPFWFLRGSIILQLRYMHAYSIRYSSFLWRMFLTST